MQYLNARCSKHHKLQLLAFLYALPKAFYFWGLGIFFVEWLVIMAEEVSVTLTAGFSAIIIIAGLALQAAKPWDSLVSGVSRFFSFKMLRRQESEISLA